MYRFSFKIPLHGITFFAKVPRFKNLITFEENYYEPGSLTYRLIGMFSITDDDIDKNLAIVVETKLQLTIVCSNTEGHMKSRTISFAFLPARPKIIFRLQNHTLKTANNSVSFSCTSFPFQKRSDRYDKVEN